MAPRTSIGPCPRITLPAWATTSESRGCWKSTIQVERSWSIPLGGRLDIPPGATVRMDPDYRKFDRALKTQMRPVLVPLQRLPFRDFVNEEFLGRNVFNC